MRQIGNIFLVACIGAEAVTYLLSKDLGVLAEVGNNDKLLGSLSNDLLLQVGGSTSLDGVQLSIDLISAVDSDINVRVPKR